MQHRQLVKPCDHGPHREDAWALLVPVLPRGGSAVNRPTAQSSAYLLAFPLFDDNINSYNWLLKSLDTFGQKLFDLCVL